MSYDAMGNRTDHSDSVVAGNRYFTFNGAYVHYDDDGNVISKVGSNYWQYSWDAENRLDSTVVNTWGMVRFDYNALGKPVRKVTRTASSGWVVESYYIWDGDQLLLELDASGNRRADYVYF